MSRDIHRYIEIQFKKNFYVIILQALHITRLYYAFKKMPRATNACASIALIATIMAQ